MKAKDITKEKPDEGERVLIINNKKELALFAVFNFSKWHDVEGCDGMYSAGIVEFPFWIRITDIINICFKENLSYNFINDNDRLSILDL